MSEREVKTARYTGTCRACRRYGCISEGDQIVEYSRGWAKLACVIAKARECPYCKAEREVSAARFFAKWLPARQHASDDQMRAVVTATYPFEFRCRESWGVKMYLRFPDPPHDVPGDMRTAADVLSGQRFGPFQCFCEADELVSEWFKVRTGDDPSLANLMPAFREVVTGITGEDS